jgi:hypothetical protein
MADLLSGIHGAVRGMAGHLSHKERVEAAFSSIKRCWGPDITSIKGWLKRRELAIKVLAYNLKRALYVEQGKEWGIPLWLNCQ